jgi:hypothetical protein
MLRISRKQFPTVGNKYWYQITTFPLFLISCLWIGHNFRFLCRIVLCECESGFKLDYKNRLQLVCANMHNSIAHKYFGYLWRKSLVSELVCLLSLIIILLMTMKVGYFYYFVWFINNNTRRTFFISASKIWTSTH